MTRRLLHDGHRRELEEASAIDPEVVAERGYESVARPAAGTDEAHRRRLAQLGIPRWATREDANFPGLLIPVYGPTGQRVSFQFKPRRPVPDERGRPRRYASPAGQASRLDVHPRNTASSADPTCPLWITEGIKKADSLTSQGLCVVALAGVFNWRSTHGTLGDWEDIALRGRTVTICFDADAATNPNVARAMGRLGAWLRSKGTAKVHYLVVPAEVDGSPTKGADDYLAVGGTLGGLEAACTGKPPDPDLRADTFTDSRLAETIADDVLAERFMWVSGLGWLGWDGHRWRDATDATVAEAVRIYTLARHRDASIDYALDQNAKPALGGWYTMLSAGRQRTVLNLARGIVEQRAEDLDSDPDLLNTPTGIVDLRTGELSPSDPGALMTKVTGADYKPGATHPDWDSVLSALPPELHDWWQLRIGQAFTGHMTPDDVLLVCQGGGANGKSTLFDALAKAAGGYQTLLSDRVLTANPDAHPTEFMDLLGVRLATLEETPEARRLDPQRLKRTVGTPWITARRIRQDSVTFRATHTMIVATNHRPVVTDSDHGTWRRLALVRFPYTYRGPAVALAGPDDRRGDGALRGRVAADPDIWAAVLAWAVTGAGRWYAAGQVMPPLPDLVESDTRDWRREADQVIAYADEHLVFDVDRHVSATDLLVSFNEWLVGNAHSKWSKETLAARFGGHDELGRGGIERRKVSRGPELSRPGGLLPDGRVSPVPARYWAWAGVRFREDRDPEWSSPPP